MKIEDFQKIIWTHYKTSGRHDLPWRKTKDVYAVMVSEIMLQQTQVNRVLEKYAEWMTRFPTLEVLASASLQEVLLVWKGLGYPRRAKYLYQIAQMADREEISLGKNITPEYLDALPGIGPYTARAIYTFTQNKREVFIETNIRTIFTHHFFNKKEFVTDDELLIYIEKTLPESNYREWYWALMDYGSFLKQSGIRINAKSTHYRKQTSFKGSMREVRSAVLHMIATSDKGVRENQFIGLPFSSSQIENALASLVSDGLIQCKQRRYTIC